METQIIDGFLCDRDDTTYLAAELAGRGEGLESTSPPPIPGLLLAPRESASTPLQGLTFLRQWLPAVQQVRVPSIRLGADLLVAHILELCPKDQPLRLHIGPHYQTTQSTHAGENRCRLIAQATLEQLARRSREMRRRCQLTVPTPEFPPPFLVNESLVQFILTEPELAWLSIAPAPLPISSRAHRRLSPFLKGDIPIAVDLTAPSRAFAKLVEAEIRLGRKITSGESCVDLGACPGSWTYVAVHRGARVTAVDRSALREDLLRHPRVRFQPGDAFKFRPEKPVDWLICDVIAAPERSIELVLNWVRARWCRHFVVSIKFKGDSQYGLLPGLRNELREQGTDFGLARLCANRNEVCVYGSVTAQEVA